MTIRNIISEEIVPHDNAYIYYHEQEMWRAFGHSAEMLRAVFPDIPCGNVPTPGADIIPLVMEIDTQTLGEMLHHLRYAACGEERIEISMPETAATTASIAKM